MSAAQQLRSLGSYAAEDVVRLGWCSNLLVRGPMGAPNGGAMGMCPIDLLL